MNGEIRRLLSPFLNSKKRGGGELEQWRLHSSRLGASWLVTMKLKPGHVTCEIVDGQLHPKLLQGAHCNYISHPTPKYVKGHVALVCPTVLWFSIRAFPFFIPASFPFWRPEYERTSTLLGPILHSSYSYHTSITLSYPLPIHFLLLSR